VDIIALDHVQLAAPPGCEAAARRFFGELLGLLEIEKPGPLQTRGGVWFRVGYQQLHVGVQEPHRPASKAHPALLVQSGRLQALADRLLAAGADVQCDQELPGVRRFYTHDPWGNRIELLEGPEDPAPPAGGAAGQKLDAAQNRPRSALSSPR
jgi:catechol 2,3-dioxygenase-like lactoylglutathione lyase family enzyme